jgi:hypothetical protein
VSKPDVKCPTCGADAGKSCRALLTGRVTDVHAARWTALYGGFQRRWILSPGSTQEDA